MQYLVIFVVMQSSQRERERERERASEREGKRIQIPLKVCHHRPTCKRHLMLGHHRPDCETPFKLRFAGGPMIARF